MNRIKAMVTQVLQAPDVVPALAKYIAGNIKGASEADILKSIKDQVGDLSGKQFIRKFYSAEKIDVVEAERSVVGVISTAAKDRDREIVDPGGVILSDYQKNRVVLYSHDYHSLPVGRNMWIKRKGDALIAKTEFATRPPDLPDSQPWLPDQIYHLMKEGFLNGFSIGFIPLEERELEEAETKSGVERAWSKWLMLEYSIVAVPSNPEAVAVEIKTGAINHQTLIDDLVTAGLEIEIEENTEMKTTEEAPKEAQVDERGAAVPTIEICKSGIWAEMKSSGPVYYFEDDVWSDEMANSWIANYGEAVKDILEDEVIKGEDGLPDPELLKAALDKLGVETTSGTGEEEIEIKIEEGEDEPEKEEAGEGEGEGGEEEEEPVEEKAAEGKAAADGVVMNLDASEFMEQLKSVREEITELKEGRVLSKSTRSLVEEAVGALQELLDKADSRAVVEEEEKEFEIEENHPAHEEPITKEQIKELLSSPEGASFLKEQFARLSGKM